MKFTHKATGQKLEVEKSDKIYNIIASSPSWRAEQPIKDNSRK